MREGGRIAAAIEVLTDIETRHKPAKLALKAWGDASRFAGAKDRAWVSGLVLDALRRRRSLAWRMGADTPRAAVLGALAFDWGFGPERLTEACAETPHGPGVLTGAERAGLADPRPLSEAPAPVRGDYPDWLDPYLARVFGEARAEEAAAFAERAPVDLRVNTLKSNRDEVLAALEGFGALAEPRLPTAVRVPPPRASERAAPVEIHPAFAMGWFEVQDLGSQIAAATAGTVRDLQVLDFCAGGGGKTLALAAAMGNTGRIFAYDSDARRMTDIIPRAQRAGVTNLELRTPLAAEPLKGLEGAMDLVFVDAPCTGTGTWRRRPDAKWRLSEDQLARRMDEQNGVLKQAARYVKPGGRLIYVTCSVLAEENEDRVAAFVAGAGAGAFRATGEVVRLSPLSAGTDGFFAAALERA